MGHNSSFGHIAETLQFFFCVNIRPFFLKVASKNTNIVGKLPLSMLYFLMLPLFLHLLSLFRIYQFPPFSQLSRH